MPLIGIIKVETIKKKITFIIRAKLFQICKFRKIIHQSSIPACV